MGGLKAGRAGADPRRRRRGRASPRPRSRSAIGAEIFGTASASKHDAIRAQGVEHAIDYRNQDFAAEAMRITGGDGLDLIIDAIGPSSFRKDYRHPAPGRAPGHVRRSREVQTGEKRDIAGRAARAGADAAGDDAVVEEPRR